MIQAFAVRHKPTGKFMPTPTGKGGRGASYWDPLEESVNDLPRLFPSKKSAGAALTQWLRGHHEPKFEWEQDATFSSRCRYQVQAGTEIVPVVTRKREEMEVVRFRLVEMC
ncbi:hypothetical protein D3C81_441910 [compost metagenome]